jgi:WD40 repeat protein
MKLNPNGSSIAIGDRNGNIHILDLQTFKQIALVEAHDSEVLSVDYGQSSDMSLYLLILYLKIKLFCRCNVFGIE